MKTEQKINRKQITTTTKSKDRIDWKQIRHAQVVTRIGGTRRVMNIPF